MSKVQVIAKSFRLEGRACATSSFDEQRKKYLFVILSVLGWSKLLSLDWLSRKFPRLNIFARKKIIDVR